MSVISTKRKDWNLHPAESSPKGIVEADGSVGECSVQEKQEESQVLVQVKGRRDEEDTLSSCHTSQADWIRQYMRKLEEVLIKTDTSIIYFSQNQKQNSN